MEYIGFTWQKLFLYYFKVKLLSDTAKTLYILMKCCVIFWYMCTLYNQVKHIFLFKCITSLWKKILKLLSVSLWETWHTTIVCPLYDVQYHVRTFHLTVALYSVITPTFSLASNNKHCPSKFYELHFLTFCMGVKWCDTCLHHVLGLFPQTQWFPFVSMLSQMTGFNFVWGWVMFYCV